MPPITRQPDSQNHGEQISQDHPCIICNYNLIGLQDGGQCPECNTPIQRSIHGESLSTADPKWIEDLARGSNFLVYCALTWIILIVGSVSVMFVLVLIGLAIMGLGHFQFLMDANGLPDFGDRLLTWIVSAAVVISTFFWFRGWGLLAIAEPAIAINGGNARSEAIMKVCGRFGTFCFVLAVLSLILLPSDPWAKALSICVVLATELFMGIQAFVGAGVIKRLASRIPTANMGKSVRRFRLFTVLAFLGMLQWHYIYLADRRGPSFQLTPNVFLNLVLGWAGFLLSFAPLLWFGAFGELLLSFRRQMRLQSQGQALQVPAEHRSDDAQSGAAAAESV